MEKKQVSTFLKILQIPSNAPPEEIKESLLASGWNEDDALEAISVLYPEYRRGDGEVEVKDTSQIVAQKYVKQADIPERSFAPSADAIEHAAADTPKPAPAAIPAVEPDVEPAKEVAEEDTVPPADSKVPIPKDLDPAQERTRPHTDAPWLQHSVDIYDISEEEKEEMIRTVYRTNERLSPQTIHALLGIDVDLSEYEAAHKGRKEPEGVGMFHILVILLASLVIAVSALFFGLYYFEVGPFHPTVTSGRG